MNAELEKLLLSNFILSSAAVRVLTEAGILDPDKLAQAVDAWGDVFAGNPALRQAHADAVDAVKNLPRPSL